MSDHTTHDDSVKLCECGCGQPAPIAKQSNPRLGIVKGQPQRFVHNHHKRIHKSVEDHFWTFCSPDAATECWEWQGSKLAQGYGRLKHHDKSYKAHRLSWEIHNGPIPDGMDVLHTCDNRPCCNPAHLFLGTQADNNADMMAKGRHATPCGEQSCKAKYTESDIVEIRRLHASGIRQSVIARRYNMRRGTVNDIVLRKTWKHVP